MVKRSWRWWQTVVVVRRLGGWQVVGGDAIMGWVADGRGGAGGGGRLRGGRAGGWA